MLKQKVIATNARLEIGWFHTLSRVVDRRGAIRYFWLDIDGRRIHPIHFGITGRRASSEVLE
jgi:hypothetical protein